MSGKAGSSTTTGNQGDAGDGAAGDSGSGVVPNVGAESGDDGGCGCHTVGSTHSPFQGSAAGLLVALGLLARRRRISKSVSL